MAPVGNAMSTMYCYNQKGQLTIFWKGKKVAERTGVKSGDAFIVSCDGGKPELHKLRVPHRNEDLLMWLLSFGKENRTYSEEKYVQLFSERRCQNYWSMYSDWTIEGPGYAFALCNRPDCGGVIHMAAYVDRNKVDKAMVREVFLKWERGIYWPRDFVENILKERFGFTKTELRTLVYEIESTHSCFWWG